MTGVCAALVHDNASQVELVVLPWMYRVLPWHGLCCLSRRHGSLYLCLPSHALHGVWIQVQVTRELKPVVNLLLGKSLVVELEATQMQDGRVSQLS